MSSWQIVVTVLLGYPLLSFLTVAILKGNPVKQLFKGSVQDKKGSRVIAILSPWVFFLLVLFGFGGLVVGITLGAIEWTVSLGSRRKQKVFLSYLS